MHSEIDEIVARYGRRRRLDATQYSLLNTSTMMMVQEKERALRNWLHACQIAPVASKTLLEIGCGAGDNFLQFLRFGFRPEKMTGNDLLPERTAKARQVLPSTLRIIEGNALDLDFPEGAFDIVYQSTLFTSILDNQFQEQLARRMWSWAAPGGGVLWYDFLYNNYRNPDVRGVSLRRMRALFPEGRIRYWRVTLAPPLSRLVTAIHPGLYSFFNSMPVLRTHVLCWIRKD